VLFFCVSHAAINENKNVARIVSFINDNYSDPLSQDREARTSFKFSHGINCIVLPRESNTLLLLIYNDKRHFMHTLIAHLERLSNEQRVGRFIEFLSGTPAPTCH
jgi:hypothetical protein